MKSFIQFFKQFLSIVVFVFTLPFISVNTIRNYNSCTHSSIFLFDSCFQQRSEVTQLIKELLSVVVIIMNYS